MLNNVLFFFTMVKSMRLSFWVFLLLVLLSGCASKENFIVLMPGSDGEVGALQLSNAQGEVLLDQQGQAVYAGGRNVEPSAPVKVDTGVAREQFSEALQVQPKAPQSFLLYFEFDSTALTAKSQHRLSDILAAVYQRDSHDLSVIGHTDRAGDYNYNLELSLRRASAVRDLLIRQGVEGSYVCLSSHGEGNPLIPTADGVAEQRNRRVEVVVR